MGILNVDVVGKSTRVRFKDNVDAKGFIDNCDDPLAYKNDWLFFEAGVYKSAALQFLNSRFDFMSFDTRFWLHKAVAIIKCCLLRNSASL